MQFGKMQVLQRVHFHISHALELGLRDRHAECLAYLCQLLRAMHQVVLDGGGWEDASGFLPTEDPFQTVEFAGDDSEVETLAARREALDTLRKKKKPAKGNAKGEDEA